MAKVESPGYSDLSRSAWSLLGALLVVVMLPVSSWAQTPADYYKQHCASCHTIGGGRLTGPDLKDATKRQSRDWLVAWLLDPQGVLGSGDPYAVRLQKESRGAVMTKPPGITRGLAEALLDLLDAESALEKSQFAGSQISDRPLLPEDIDAGRALFLGKTKLSKEGPACLGCHTVNSIGSLGGGRLGPNLTRSYATLEGRKGLSSWLQSPPSRTMQPIFASQPLDDEEILALVAFLKQETERDLPQNQTALINFLIAGIAGGVILLVLFDLIWNKRFRAVRRPLVETSYPETVSKDLVGDKR